MSGEASGDIFDAVLRMEEEFIQQGVALGETQGLQQGFSDGKALGEQKGSEIGKELGFYAGCVAVWSALAKKHPDKFSAKSLTTMSKMAELIQAYPLGDALDERLSEKLQLIRAKYKVLVSLLGYNSKFQRKADTLSF